MRKFIMSDIHGFGNVYYSIMSYLDNISKNEEIELYINGDLIDRGLESADILLDIKKRIEENKFKIVYLGGNHELMMYDFFKDEKNNQRNIYNDWYRNGGYITYDSLYDKLLEENKVKEVVDFVSNLKIYHKFDEKVGNKPIVLVHSACPEQVNDECLKRIKDNDGEVFYTTWTREHNITEFLGIILRDPVKNRIGHKDYFTIIGHTPNNNPLGYDYYKNGNYLNIDGGCAPYVSGYFEYNHFPLVEVCYGYLKILTFNSNNEIICANYFDGNRSFAYNTNEIEEARSHLNNKVKIKKLSINEDGICGYWN